MYDDLILQVARQLAQIDRRLARLEVGETSAGGTATMSAADILTAIKTVDGSASGLDADLLDGISSAGFVGTATYTASDVIAKLLTVDGSGTGLDADTVDGLHAADLGGTASMTAAEILAALITVDGTASLLDADLLDGLEGSAYSGTAHTHAAYLGTADYTAADVLSKLLTVDGTASLLDADLLDGNEASAFAPTYNASVPVQTTGTAYNSAGTAATPARIDHRHQLLVTYDNMPNVFSTDAGKVWGRAVGAGEGISTLLGGSALIAILGTADGAGSGLDADYLDGSHASAFSGTAHTHAAYVGTATYVASDVLAKLLTVDGTASLLDADKLDGLEGAAYSGTAHTHTGYAETAEVTAGTILAKLLTVDGTASLLDADKLDGLEGSSYVGTSTYTAADVLSKLLTVDGTASLLDADLLDGLEGAAYVGTATLASYLKVDGSTPLTGAWNAGSVNVTTIGGKIGIGTATPTYNLEVVNNQSAITAIEVRNTDAGTAALTQYRLAGPGGGAFSVGLAGTAHATLPGYAGYAFFDANTLVDGFIISATKSTGTIQLRTAGRTSTETRMIIDGAGLVGIGVTPATQKLKVLGGVAVGGDDGGTTGYVAFSNVVTESISTGIGSIKMSGTTARTNTGFMKIYVSTAARYIPYYTTITG